MSIQFITRSVSSLITIGVILWANSLRANQIEVRSPNNRNVITLDCPDTDSGIPRYSVFRDDFEVIESSQIFPVLATESVTVEGSKIVSSHRGTHHNTFEFKYGKNRQIKDDYSYGIVRMRSEQGNHWSIELRAYNDGVAFRYVVPASEPSESVDLQDEQTEFKVAGRPQVLFNTLKGFTTSHESLYSKTTLHEMPAANLIEMPATFVWADQCAAAICEARVRDFANAYLERPNANQTTLRCRLAPHPSHAGLCVVAKGELKSPWRVVMIGESAGQLIENNLLLCLNDPPQESYDWLQVGKSTWHWWNGEFEQDYRLPLDSTESLDRHKKYIDFCAENGIAFHAVSGDGGAWYEQSRRPGSGYGKAAADANVLKPRSQIRLDEILAYAQQRGVGIRLWVHWKPLSENLEQAFALYKSWGVKGLMVDFLNRDDQEMVNFIERVLECAARHNLHVQLHGSGKYSGEQRTFPHLLNREGVLNLETLKWSKSCTPQHNVNVAFARNLTGPVDYHLGGFRSVSRAQFRSARVHPNVLGTRCHHLALYVVYENPMPMLCDTPESYMGQDGFEFLKAVPTTWDETRFIVGELGEFVVVARRKQNRWYLAGITNWTKREVAVPLTFLEEVSDVTTYRAEIYRDGDLTESEPNLVTREARKLDKNSALTIPMAPGGGFVAVLHAE